MLNTINKPLHDSHNRFSSIQDVFPIDLGHALEPTQSSECREYSTPFRIFPTKGKPECYSILFACSYQTKYGFYDLLGEGIPEEVAIMILEAVHEKMKKPDSINMRSHFAPRFIFMLAGAEVWGNRGETWWHGLASKNSVCKGNRC